MQTSLRTLSYPQPMKAEELLLPPSMGDYDPMSRFPNFQSSNFAQRQFEVPVHDEDMDSISQSSSNLALHQPMMQTQLVSNSQISPVESATSRRGLLGNMFGGKGRRTTAAGPEVKMGT